MLKELFLFGTGVLRMTINGHKFCFPILLFSSIVLLMTLSSGQALSSFPLSGHLKLRTDISGYDSGSIFSLAGVGPYLDGQMDVRLKNTCYLSDDVYIQTHYESVLTGGDTRRKINRLLNQLGLKGIQDLLPSNEIEDDRRLMDLTHKFTNEDKYIGYHRLDRLALGIKHRYATIILGRQAQTWGNGMVFNPMDLFNPFSPTDIQRDYKIGADMIALTLPNAVGGDLQILYVVRRDSNHDIKWDYSSLAGKYHRIFNTLEINFMGGRHYEAFVVGLGATGYVKNAAWRMDGTWTFLDAAGYRNDDNGFFFLCCQP